MSDSITISPSEIRQIFQPRTSSALEIWELTQKANTFAVIIDSRWDQLPTETRELLKIFAYAVIEPPQGIKWIFVYYLGRCLWNFSLFLIQLKGEKKSLIAYNEAFERLINAILSAIEREDMAYQKSLSEALEETLAGLETSEAMTAEDACERIRAISNQALE